MLRIIGMDSPPAKRRKTGSKTFEGFVARGHGSSALITHGEDYLGLRDILNIVEESHLGTVNTPCPQQNVNFKVPIKKSIIIAVRNPLTMYPEKSSSSVFLRRVFNCKWRVVPDKQLTEELIMTLAVICSPEQLLSGTCPSLAVAKMMMTNPLESFKSVYNFTDNDRPEEVIANELVDRRKLCLSLSEQIELGLPTPLTCPSSFRLAKKYKFPMANSPIVGIDCEGLDDLSRVALVGEDCKEILDTLITNPKRQNEKEQFERRFGENIPALKMTLKQAQLRMRELLPADSLLVAHDIRRDMTALGICHPAIIDTSVLYNCSTKKNARASLLKLAEKHLVGESPDHLPLNDARAAVKLAKEKLTHGFEFGNKYLLQRRRRVTSAGTGSVLGTNNCQEMFMDAAEKCLPVDELFNTEFQSLESNAEIINRATEIIHQNEDCLVIVNTAESMSSSTLDNALRQFWDAAEVNTAFYLLLNSESGTPGTAFMTLKTMTAPSSDVLLSGVAEEITRLQRFSHRYHDFKESATSMFRTFKNWF